MGNAGLQGKLILIVEDSPLIALDLQAALESAGALVVCSDCARAVVLVERPFLSAVILDCGPYSSERRAIVRRLSERGVPFMFYGVTPPAIKSGAGTLFLAKPAPPEKIVATLTLLVKVGKSPGA